MGVKADELKANLVTLQKLCNEANRDFSKLEITVFAPLGQDPRATMDAYRAAGAHRLVLFPPTLAPDKYEAELEELAAAWVV